MPQPLVSGPRVVLYINGQMFGRVADFSWTSDTPKKEIRGIDSFEIYELAPLSRSVSGTMTVYRLIGDGGAEGAGMVAPWEFGITEKYFTITLVERTSDTVLFSATQCSVLNQSWSVTIKNLMRGTISWRGTFWSNETA